MREGTLGDSFDLSGLLDEFRDEARGQLEQLDDALLKLERDGILAEADAGALLRALHTLKGNSGMLGFAAIRDYVHEIEAVFRTPRQGWPQPLLDRLFEGAATLRRAVEHSGTDDEPAAVARLTSLPRPGGHEPASDATARRDDLGVADTVSPVREDPGDDDAGGASFPLPDAAGEPLDPPEVGVSTEMLRVSFEKLDSLANRVAELLGIHSALEDLIRTHRDALDSIQLRRPLQRLAEQTETVAASLRDAATDLRLVPVGRVFRRFPSLVRDLARAQSKQVQVVLDGEDTELDKSTVDILGEPLLHLVRNAVDHGIGTPEERGRVGKPAEGVITLRAVQSGDTVRIEVEDDGTGLDRRRILERARASGMVEPEEELTAGEVADLIFRPGFSTRSEADTVSGRGLGMDIVASSVARLRGSLEVEDAPGRGTRFVMNLPLTVAILPVLVFESAGQTLALPALDVEDIHRPERISWVAGAEVITHEGEVVPLARLERVFGWDAATGDESREPAAPAQADDRPPRFVLLVRRGSRAAALVADRLLDQRDVVVKALPGYLGQPSGVSGASIAPDGQVVLLLDAGGIIDLNLETHRRIGRVATTG